MMLLLAITDKKGQQWQEKPLQRFYTLVYMDAIHFNVKQDNQVVKKVVYPYTEIQNCIVHQIRNSTRFVSYKNFKSFMSDLKEVYKATTEEVAVGNLEKFEEKWGKNILEQPDLDELIDMNYQVFLYPLELRKLIYTTNSIENFNRQLRKVTKSIFPNR